jgi:hypothetical protein
MSIGWLPTLIAVCSRKDGSIKAHGIAVETADGEQAVVGRVARDLRRLGHVLEDDLLAHPAEFGVDQKQCRLRVVDLMWPPSSCIATVTCR